MFQTYDSYSAIILCEFPALFGMCMWSEKLKAYKDGFLSSSFSVQPPTTSSSFHLLRIYIYIYIREYKIFIHKRVNCAGIELGRSKKIKH